MKSQSYKTHPIKVVDKDNNVYYFMDKEHADKIIERYNLVPVSITDETK